MELAPSSTVAVLLRAGWASAVLTNSMIAEMTAMRGVLMLAISLGLLELEIRTGNFLPAIVIVPIIVAIVELIQMVVSL